jgi:outer membrane protein assembly factor BamD (BamD/ComL family)
VSAKARARVLIPSACLVATLLAALASCAGAPQTVSADLGPAEYFQRAQDAAESGNFAVALRYYQSFQAKYPEDAEHGAWASYEIAFLYHKMGDDKKCITLLDELLARYAKGEQLPDAPRILALKVKARLEAKAAPSSSPAEAPSSTPAGEPTPAPAPAS